MSVSSEGIHEKVPSEEVKAEPGDVLAFGNPGPQSVIPFNSYSCSPTTGLIKRNTHSATIYKNTPYYFEVLGSCREYSLTAVLRTYYTV